MNILFCGAVVPESVEYVTPDISAAGNRFQNNTIKNLEEAGHKVWCCSFLGMPVSERAKEVLRRESETGKRNYIFKGKNIGDSIGQYRRLVKMAMGDTKTVICYNITYAWLLLPLWAKKQKKQSILILADYSEAISYRSIYRKLYAKLQLWSMRRFNTVVGLSAGIQPKLRKQQKFILMEGGIDRSFYDFFSYSPHREDQPLMFLYSGLLSKVTGVDMLLEAMSLVEERDIRLMITGKGPLEAEVRRAAQSDSRISYGGHLSYEEYMQQLGQADILLNPRNMELPENKNNFPSKVLDYLASGKRILSTRFAGWENFTGYMVWCDSRSPALAAGIKDLLLHKDSPESFLEQRTFAKNFLWEEQIKKILYEEK